MDREFFYFLFNHYYTKYLQLVFPIDKDNLCYSVIVLLNCIYGVIHELRLVLLFFWSFQLSLLFEYFS